MLFWGFDWTKFSKNPFEKVGQAENFSVTPCVHACV